MMNGKFKQKWNARADLKSTVCKKCGSEIRRHSKDSCANITKYHSAFLILCPIRLFIKQIYMTTFCFVTTLCFPISSFCGMICLSVWWMNPVIGFVTKANDEKIPIGWWKTCHNSTNVSKRWARKQWAGLLSVITLTFADGHSCQNQPWRAETIQVEILSQECPSIISCAIVQISGHVLLHFSGIPKILT